MEIIDEELYDPREEKQNPETRNGNDGIRSVGTFIWTIKNFTRWFDLRNGPLRSELQDLIVSPWFFFDLFEGNWWYLVLLIEDDDNKIGFGINRLQRNIREEKLEAEIELSFLADDGSILIQRRTQKSFSGEGGFLFECFVHEDEVLVKGRNEFLPNDTLIARCRIWKTSDRFKNPVVCFGSSEMLIENGSSVFSVERFSSLKVGQKHYFDVGHNVLALSSLIISIYLADDGDVVQVEIVASSMKSSKRVMLEISAIDATGNIFNSSTLDFFIENGISRFKQLLRKSDVMANKSKYLPNDSLILRCRYVIVYANEIECGKRFSKSIEAHSYALRELKHRTENNTSAIAMQLVRDLTDIYVNNTLSDVNIRVGKENFLAHKLILSARSPMLATKFCTDLDRMHTTDLNAKDDTDLYGKDDTDQNAKDNTDIKQKDAVDKKNVSDLKRMNATDIKRKVLNGKGTTDLDEMAATNIDLSDLDTETMRVLLKYMYTDVVEDLQWNTATRLYLAADKYQLLFLKDMCSAFLKANLSTLNVYEALLFADMHNDDGLKNGIQDFILHHENEIIHSEEWNSLKANHKLLAFETIESLYLKKLKLSDRRSDFGTESCI